MQKCPDEDEFDPDVEVFTSLQPNPLKMPKNCEKNLQKCEKSLKSFSSYELECEYFNINSEYTCIASKTIANHQFMEISRVLGTHQSLKSNFHVLKLRISNSILKFFNNEIFRFFENLQSVEIINSQLSNLELPKISSNSLKNLHVELNKIYKISKNSFEEAKNLEELILIKNGIEILENGAFDGLSKLQKLDLKSNKISALPTGIFDDLRELTHLSVAENKIEFLSGDLLRNLEKLKVVKFNGNEIKIISENFLSGLRFLEKFDFEGTCVGKNLKQIRRVEEINEKIRENCRRRN